MRFGYAMIGITRASTRLLLDVSSGNEEAAVIRIQYVPPASSSQLPDDQHASVSWTPDAVTVRPYDTDIGALTKGTRSRLALETVGTRGRKRRNERDSLALSKEWRELGSKAAGDAWNTLHDATTALDAEGQPNLNALRQAQRQLRQWFFQQAQGEKQVPDLQAHAARVDALLERLIRRNLINSQGPKRGEGGAVIAKDSAGESPFQALLDFLRPGGRTAATLHRRGLRLWAVGQPEAALAALEAAALKAPKSARIQLDLGRVLMDEGHYGEAEWVLLSADDLAPRKNGAQLALGELYLEMGQPLMAIGAFKTAVARNPADTDAQAQLGVAYYEQGDLASATPHLQKAVLLDQQGVVARFYLAQISLQENDLLRARFQLGMVAKLSPTMDLARFDQNAPKSLASRTASKTTPLHHWQLPAQSPTKVFNRTPTGPLSDEGTSVLVDPPAP
jgi:tetratricopeptide (TPR) repeat protein